MHIFRKETILEIPLSQNLKQMISLITKTLLTGYAQDFTIVEMVRDLRSQTYQNLAYIHLKKNASHIKLQLKLSY